MENYYGVLWFFARIPGRFLLFRTHLFRYHVIVKAKITWKEEFFFRDSMENCLTFRGKVPEYWKWTTSTQDESCWRWSVRSLLEILTTDITYFIIIGRRNHIQTETFRVPTRQMTTSIRAVLLSRTILGEVSLKWIFSWLRCSFLHKSDKIYYFSNENLSFLHSTTENLSFLYSSAPFRSIFNRYLSINHDHPCKTPWLQYPQRYLYEIIYDNAKQIHLLSYKAPK